MVDCILFQAGHGKAILTLFNQPANDFLLSTNTNWHLYIPSAYKQSQDFYCFMYVCVYLPYRWSHDQ